ncbi:helitron_like_N domain-containing protein [Trichonephila clavipes]|nr:helitron_like_N domain-containing protein [Trichonephila clavipes]
MYLTIAPGEGNVPVSLLFDEHAEELSFPQIYLGQFRTFRDGVNVTSFMMATSELRRSDRREEKRVGIEYRHRKTLQICRELCRRKDADDGEDIRDVAGRLPDQNPFQELYNNPTAEINGDLLYAMLNKLELELKKKKNIMSYDDFYDLMRRGVKEISFNISLQFRVISGKWKDKKSPDDFTRGRMIGKVEAGRTITSVAAEFETNKKVSFRALEKAFQTTGTAVRKVGGGRLRTTTARDD